MKILYVVHITHNDGSTLSFLTLLKGTLSFGHEAVVIMPEEDSEFVLKLDSINVKHYVLPVRVKSWPGFVGLKRKMFYPFVLIRDFVRRKKEIVQLDRVVRIERPDIIHTNVSPVDIGHVVAKKNHIPHVWHIREYCDKDFSIRLFPSGKFYRKQFRGDWTVAITKDLQSYNSLIDCDHSFVIYNGVRSIKDACFYPHKQKYFLCASRISEEKGHDRMIRVFASFVKSNPEYKLIILGEGYDYYVNSLKLLVRELGAEDSICFEGFTSDVDSYLRYASALLVASPSEGFGRMTAEAAFAGCLVIGFNSAGTKEILEETGGFLWDNDTDFEKAMEYVANMSEEEYKSKALYAQSRAKSLYSQESYISSMMSLYSEILN